jgi:hypothetical protein
MVAGLPSKMAAVHAAPGLHGSVGELVFMGYSDVGRLNQFVELWRYPTFQNHIQVREAVRGGGF